MNERFVVTGEHNKVVTAGEFLERVNALLCEHKNCTIDCIYVQYGTMYFELSVTGSVSMSERNRYKAGMSLFKVEQGYDQMADILFRPICSNCKCIIEGLVASVDWEDHDHWVTMGPMHQIIPYACKNCGSVFDYIEMPTKLPFYSSTDPSIVDKVKP